MNLKDDPRYIAMYRGLGQLDDSQIRRIIETRRELMVLDEFNYDESRGTFCPIAIGLGVHYEMVALEISRGFPITNKSTERKIGQYGRQMFGPGFLYNQMHGTPGNFYRENRYDDLMTVCRDLLEDRKNNP